MFNYTEFPDEKVEYFEIAPASEIPNGERLFVEIGEAAVVIFNIAGKYFAIGDVCTHDVVCPRPGAEFDVRSGEAVGMPAVVDIPAYPVQVREGTIYIGVPKE
jgi:3-phenylpropionate/trans-cinnamate dioxygenase ferredoxin subunit